MARTKILATVRPLSCDKLEEMIEAGLDGIRFNGAHVKPIDEDYAHVSNVIEVAHKINPNIFTVFDLEGPKARLGNFDSLKVSQGDRVEIVPASLYSGKGIPVQYDELPNHVKEGNLLLIDDGKVGLRVKTTSRRGIECEVEYGDIIESRKGVNTPYVSLPMQYLSGKDPSHLEFIAKNKIDFVSASFVRTIFDLEGIYSKLENSGVKVIGKPENHEGSQNLDSIVKRADAMMIPRGDYGMELGVIEVPAFQKLTIRKCNALGKPVITATQMMESMMYRKEPDRSNVSDVFNACLDGTDVVMLSGETTVGKYPVESVRMMNSILDKAEKYMFRYDWEKLGDEINRMIPSDNIPDLVSKSVYAAVKDSNVDAIIVPTKTGRTARMISRFRMNQPVIALTYDPQVARQLNMSWGVIPVLTEEYKENVSANAIRTAIASGYVGHGNSVLVTKGDRNHGKGMTNSLEIIENI